MEYQFIFVSLGLGHRIFVCMVVYVWPKENIWYMKLCITVMATRNTYSTNILLFGYLVVFTALLHIPETRYWPWGRQHSLRLMRCGPQWNCASILSGDSSSVTHVSSLVLGLSSLIEVSGWWLWVHVFIKLGIDYTMAPGCWNKAFVYLTMRKT